MQADIPEAMYESRLDHIVEEFSYRLSMQGMTLDAYLKMNQLDMPSFRLCSGTRRKKQVKMSLALEYISKAENVTVSGEDIQKKYEEMAQRYKMDIAKVREAVTEDSISRSLRSTARLN
jgi:trigger factor